MAMRFTTPFWAIVGVAILAVVLWPRSASVSDGEVESLVRVTADKVEISGWALDARRGTQVSSIFVTVNGRTIAQGSPSELRRPNKFPTGFRIVFNRDLIKGSRPQIAVFAAANDGVRELGYAKGLDTRYRASIPVADRGAASAEAVRLGFGAERRADRLTLLVDKAEL